MFQRAGLLLLLLAFITNVDASFKLHQILKNVGKRYLPIPSKGTGTAKGTGAKGTINMDWIHGGFDEKYLTWSDLPDDEIKKRKQLTADMVMEAFHEASSSDNTHFTDAMILIRTISDPDMTAEVCADGQKLNAYQYLKSLSKNAANHKQRHEDSWHQDILETDRDTLHMSMNFKTKDREDQDVTLSYDIQMTLTFTHQDKGSVYSITHVSQGGTCKVEGKIEKSKSDQTENVVQNLESHPTTELFFKLLSPGIYKNEEGKVPTSWLPALDASAVKVTICHEGKTDPVAYDEAQFLSWYKRFGEMWHPKKDATDTFGIETTKMSADSVTAKITMKLQIGRKPEADVHEWNFVFTANKNDQGVWTIVALDILCSPELKLKDNSLMAIREVVSESQTDHLTTLKPVSWHSAIDFVDQYVKDKGSLEIAFCDFGNTKRIELFGVHKYEVKYVNFKYDYKYVTIPAGDTAKFRLTTISEPIMDGGGSPTFNYVHTWIFDVKWDEMDQFYYIEKVAIECGKEERAKRNDLW
ncbi:hypothetical protein B9Z55_007010 [Caenorhabditis nigoni]|uniref:NTF2-like domain-containing protein n=1 Tax=Caenorhabditis nigoni TaxID=1611254 RepID=A0A2G5V7R6_9PELO|nr:hypothetical protein B9Z55_007010 [Caenorhabditis nigoni]